MDLNIFGQKNNLNIIYLLNYISQFNIGGLNKNTKASKKYFKYIFKNNIIYSCPRDCIIFGWILIIFLF